MKNDKRIHAFMGCKRGCAIPYTASKNGMQFHGLWQALYTLVRKHPKMACKIVQVTLNRPKTMSFPRFCTPCRHASYKPVQNRTKVHKPFRTPSNCIPCFLSQQQPRNLYLVKRNFKPEHDVLACCSACKNGMRLCSMCAKMGCAA